MIIHAKLQQHELPRVAPAVYRPIPEGLCQLCSHMGLVSRAEVLPEIDFCPICFAIWQDGRADGGLGAVSSYRDGAPILGHTMLADGSGDWLAGWDHRLGA